MSDARFEDGREKPMRLRAEDAEDLEILSAVLQDALFGPEDMSWIPARREFALLLNRFRWENAEGLAMRGQPFERVRAILDIRDVQGVRSQGIDRADADLVLSLLSMEWRMGPDGTGKVILTLSGDGVVEISAECINLTLTDVTRPYEAPSRLAPEHPE